MPAEERSVAAHLRPVRMKSPVDLIIEQICALLSDGHVKPGQKLPSETVMAQRFGLSRGTVRDALRRLEFFGIVRTQPQSGTLLVDLDRRTLLLLIQNLLEMGDSDYATYAEVCHVIEALSARLAAARATPAEIEAIRECHDAFAGAVAAGRSGYEDNLLFHLRIAAAAGNPVLRSLVSQTQPEILKLMRRLGTLGGDRARAVVGEHAAVVGAIEAGDPDAAARAMGDHVDAARRIAETCETNADPATGSN